MSDIENLTKALALSSPFEALKHVQRVVDAPAVGMTRGVSRALEDAVAFHWSHGVEVDGSRLDVGTYDEAKTEWETFARTAYSFSEEAALTCAAVAVASGYKDLFAQAAGMAVESMARRLDLGLLEFANDGFEESLSHRVRPAQADFIGAVLLLHCFRSRGMEPSVSKDTEARLAVFFADKKSLGEEGSVLFGQAEEAVGRLLFDEEYNPAAPLETIEVIIARAATAEPAVGRKMTR